MLLSRRLLLKAPQRRISACAIPPLFSPPQVPQTQKELVQYCEAPKQFECFKQVSAPALVDEDFDLPKIDPFDDVKNKSIEVLKLLGFF